MDEPTIDCYCGAHGTVQLQCQALSNQADWVTYHRCVRCSDHFLSLLCCLLEEPGPGTRIILMPL